MFKISPCIYYSPANSLPKAARSNVNESGRNIHVQCANSSKLVSSSYSEFKVMVNQLVLVHPIATYCYILWTPEQLKSL